MVQYLRKHIQDIQGTSWCHRIVRAIMDVMGKSG